MSLLSEDVKTVISCQTLTARTVNTDQLTTLSIVSDNIATNVLTLVDAEDITKTGVLEENGDTLETTSLRHCLDSTFVTVIKTQFYKFLRFDF